MVAMKWYSVKRELSIHLYLKTFRQKPPSQLQRCFNKKFPLGLLQKEEGIFHIGYFFQIFQKKNKILSGMKKQKNLLRICNGQKVEDSSESLLQKTIPLRALNSIKTRSTVQIYKRKINIKENPSVNFSLVHTTKTFLDPSGLLYRQNTLKVFKNLSDLRGILQVFYIDSRPFNYSI